MAEIITEEYLVTPEGEFILKKKYKSKVKNPLQVIYKKK